MSIYFYKDQSYYISYPLPVDDSIEEFYDLNISSIYLTINGSLNYNQIGVGDEKISISKRGSWYIEVHDEKFYDLPEGENILEIRVMSSKGGVFFENKTFFHVYEKYQENNEKEDVTPLDLLSSKNYITRDIRDERYEVCKKCPRLFKPTKTCKECGCFMAAKTWLKDATCPLDKW